MLTDIAELGTGHTPSRHHPEYWDGDIPWIGIRDAGAHHGGLIDATNQTITPLGLDNSAARLLPKDTICLSRTASVGYVVKMGRAMATSQDFVTWSCSEALDPDYLLHALLAEGDDIRNFGEGSTHTTIYFPAVKAFAIDLPPLAEQRRIVAKLDALTTRLARARAQLDRVPVLARRLRVETLRSVFAGAGQQQPLRTLTSLVTSGSRGWAKHYSDQGAVFIRIGDVRRTNIRLDLTDVQHVEPPEGAEGARTAVQPRDLVVTITADLGRVGVIPNDLPVAYVNQHVALVRLIRPELSEWVAWYLASDEGQRQMLAKDRGVTKAGLGLDDIRNTLVPLASPQTRALGMRKINSAFARAERLEAEAARARALLDRLEAAILARAFRGELVPQDPSDEPASTLLARMRAQREAAPKARRGRRTKEPANA